MFSFVKIQTNSNIFYVSENLGLERQKAFTIEIPFLCFSLSILFWWTHHCRSTLQPKTHITHIHKNCGTKNSKNCSLQKRNQAQLKISMLTKTTTRPFEKNFSLLFAISTKTSLSHTLTYTPNEKNTYTHIMKCHQEKSYTHETHIHTELTKRILLIICASHICQQFIVC